MGNRASGFGFLTAIAAIGSFIQAFALFFGKSVAYLITFDTGSTMGVADNNLLTDIGTFAAKTLCAEVVWVVKNSFWLNISHAMKPNLF